MIQKYGSPPSRYRYPLYRKRNYQNLEPYIQDEELSSYLDEDEIPQRYSLFREREQSKRNSGFNIALTPYDLETMGKLYELGKRSGEDFSDSDGHFHEVPLKVSVSPHQKRFSDSDEGSYEDYEDLKNLLQFAAQKNNLRNLLHNSAALRRKRAIEKTHSDKLKGNSTHSLINSTNGHHTIDSGIKTPHDNLKTTVADRAKRGFENYMPGAVSPQYDSASKEELNDFLTREYFKTIARSVGNKKKRMAFGQFEAEKRSDAISQMIDNPDILQMIQRKLRGLSLFICLIHVLDNIYIRDSKVICQKCNVFAMSPLANDDEIRFCV